MVDGIAKKVRERRFQPIENIPIDLGIFTGDFELHVFSQA